MNTSSNPITKKITSCLGCPGKGVRKDTSDPSRMYHCTLADYVLCDNCYIPQGCPLRKAPLLLVVDEADVRKDA